MLNLTKNTLTQKQKACGIIEPSKLFKIEIKKLLLFDKVPTNAQIEYRAEKLAYYADIIILGSGKFNSLNEKKALIDGSPFLMSSLERALFNRNIVPYYLFNNKVLKPSIPSYISVIKAIRN